MLQQQLAPQPLAIFSWLVVAIIIFEKPRTIMQNKQKQAGSAENAHTLRLGSPGDIISRFYPAVSGRLAPLAPGKARG